MTLTTSITLFLTLVSLVAAAPQPGDADFPTRNGNPRHEQKVTAIKNGNFDLVLIGDSITHEIGELDGKYKPNRAVWDRHFAPRHAINLGMNGQRTEEILWNLQNGELDFAKSPKVVMLLIGTNNADDRHFKSVHTPEQIVAGTKALVEEIRKRHPTTKILVLRIFPRGGDAEKSVSPPAFNSSATCIETCRRAGELTAQLADGKQVFWLDVNHVFLRPDGSINTGLMWDLLHPSPLGTEAWVQAAEPMLAQLMGDKPILDPSLLPAAPAPTPKPHATDDGLALTPPMGWYPWNIFGQEPQNEKLIRETVAALVASGMKDAGYAYVGPDEGICFSRGDDGKLTSNLKRYPSGLRGLGDAIHRQGLKYALYTDAGSRTCSNDMPGTKDHEYVDMAAFAEWRADYVKIDWCNTQGQDIVRTYTELHDAQHAAGRPIVHSLCSWGDGEPWKWAAPIGHLWRTASDICAPGKADWKLAMKLTAINEKLQAYGGPGHWNDPDMLITGMPGLSEMQNRSFFSLWCMMAAPLIAGNDLRSMTPETIRILTNPEAIAINQDPLGVQGHIIRTAGKVEIWAGKPLFDGSRALLLFNRGTTTEPVDIKLAEIDLKQEPGIFVRDLWKQTLMQPGISKDGVMSFQVEPNDVAFFRISNTNDFPLPPVIVADTYLVALRAGGPAPQDLTGSVNLTNRGSAELPLWKVRQDLPQWLTVAVTQSGKTQTVVNSVATAGLKKGLYHAVVRLDNTEPVSGKPMSAVYYDVDLEVTDLMLENRAGVRLELLETAGGWAMGSLVFHGKPVEQPATQGVLALRNTKSGEVRWLAAAQAEKVDARSASLHGRHEIDGVQFSWSLDVGLHAELAAANYTAKWSVDKDLNGWEVCLSYHDGFANDWRVQSYPWAGNSAEAAIAPMRYCGVPGALVYRSDLSLALLFAIDSNSDYLNPNTWTGSTGLHFANRRTAPQFRCGGGKLVAGTAYELPLQLLLSDAGNFPAAISGIMQDWIKVNSYKVDDSLKVRTPQEAFVLALEGRRKMESWKPGIGYEHHRGTPFVYVGNNPYIAHYEYRLHEITGEKLWRDRAFEQIDFALKGQQPNGAFHTSWYFKKEARPGGATADGFCSWDWHHNGYKVDINAWMVRYILQTWQRVKEKEGVDRQDWYQAAMRSLNWVLAQQNPDGGFPQVIEIDTGKKSESVVNGRMLVGLPIIAKITGDARCLRASAEQERSMRQNIEGRFWYTGAHPDLPPGDFEQDSIYAIVEYWLDKHDRTGDKECLERAVANAYYGLLYWCPKQLSWVKAPTQCAHSEQQHFNQYSVYCYGNRKLQCLDRLFKKTGNPLFEQLRNRVMQLNFYTQIPDGPYMGAITEAIADPWLERGQGFEWRGSPYTSELVADLMLQLIEMDLVTKP